MKAFLGNREVKVRQRAGSLNARLGEDGPAWSTNQGSCPEKTNKEHTCSSEWHMGHVRPQLLGDSDQEGSAILPSASPSAEDVPCLSG